MDGSARANLAQVTSAVEPHRHGSGGHATALEVPWRVPRSSPFLVELRAAANRSAWMGLVTQAGVAIGLAALSEAYPERGAYIAGMVLALIAVNESIGPILFRRALAFDVAAVPHVDAAPRSEPVDN